MPNQEEGERGDIDRSAAIEFTETGQLGINLSAGITYDRGPNIIGPTPSPKMKSDNPMVATSLVQLNSLVICV